MWMFRSAHLAEAAEACSVIRVSIERLCIADHGNDPAILEPWLANKTPEQVRSWIGTNPGGVIVGVGANGIAGVGCVLPSGTIALNYVVPWVQRQGVGSGLLRRMERIATAAGHPACHLASTVTAHDFYLAHGYVDVDEIGVSPGGKPGFPMRRELG